VAKRQSRTYRLSEVLTRVNGNGSSANSYSPLVQEWAAQGFVGLQPTHLDSRTLGLAPTNPRRPLRWRHRAEDLTHLLSQLD
jgi:predicted dienelactone hydrolase